MNHFNEAPKTKLCQTAGPIESLIETCQSRVHSLEKIIAELREKLAPVANYVPRELNEGTSQLGGCRFELMLIELSEHIRRLEANASEITDSLRI